MSVQTTHQNYTDKWYTPQPWLDWVSATFGRTDWFDPCPANWDGTTNGLELAWPGNRPVYCNHPGSRGSTKVWWEKFEFNARSRRAIWCLFNMEQLRHTDPSPFTLDGYLIMPKRRIQFIDASTGLLGKSPSNWAGFWSNVKPAETPEPCVIIKTGKVYS